MQTMRFLAKRYACAYFNVFGSTITREQSIALEHAYISLKRNKRLLFFWRLSAIDPVVKALSVERIDQKYGLGGNFKKLCYLLLEHNRLGLIPYILEQIVALYRKQNGIAHCLVMTAQPITQEMMATFIRFVEKKINKELIPVPTIDPSLIAGVRLQGQEFLWERSVKKTLRSLSLVLVR